MTNGFLAALMLLMSVGVQYTLFTALPYPWREILLPLLVGIVMMYRVSLSLGAVFLLSAGMVTVGRGLAGYDVFSAYAISALMAISLSNRVFARRSLLALSGFAFGTILVFFITKELYVLFDDLRHGEGIHMHFAFLPTIFLLSASVLGVIAISLVFTSLSGLIQRRFVRKNSAYEIETNRF